jgi:transcriptional regulator with XRE-family HTH domain
MTPSRPDPGAPTESIGALLVRVRTDAGRSQLRVAELLCAASGVPTITRHEVSRWEREARIPSGYWLRWLAAVLDVPLD